jgi:hypothetical protein
MAISMLQETPEATVEMYDAVNERIGRDVSSPPGLIVHTATPMEGGGMRFFDVWESREQLEQFREERLLPAIAAEMQERGIPMPDGPPEMKIGEVHDLVVTKTAV